MRDIIFLYENSTGFRNNEKTIKQSVEMLKLEYLML